MHKIINLDIRIRYDKENKSKISVNFINLEIEIENKLFVLNSYEDRDFNYDFNRSKILEKDKLFSFMNSKEYLITPESLFVSKNKILLEKEIHHKIKEREKKSNVSANESKTLIEDLEKNNKERLKEIYLNLIDISLDEEDIELFEKLIKAKGEFLKI